ncbi:MAG: hypothetical protein V3S29_02380, partial [bacterium]
ALKIYDSWLEISPKDFVVLKNRGYINCLIKSYALCFEDLNRAIELEKNFFPAYLNRSWAHGLMGLDTQSLDDLKKGRKIGKRSAKSLRHWHSQGVLIFAEGKGVSKASADLPPRRLAAPNFWTINPALKRRPLPPAPSAPWFPWLS